MGLFDFLFNRNKSTKCQIVENSHFDRTDAEKYLNEISISGQNAYLADELYLKAKNNPNDDNVLQVLKKAADLGHVKAIYAIAMYLNSVLEELKSCNEDDLIDIRDIGSYHSYELKETMLSYLAKAAKLGEKDAIYNLAIAIHRGDYPLEDKITDSLKLFIKAAELGSYPAYSRLAWIYANGKGTPVNRTIAKYWSWLAYANAQNEQQQNDAYFMDLIEYEDILENNVVNHRKIIEDAARAGERDALCNWGTGLLSYDKDSAIKILKESVKFGHKIAACNLGRYYWAPYNKNYEQALPLFKVASEWGCAEAQYGLAVMYFQGLGVNQDLKESWKWLQLSVNQGCKEAQAFLSLTIDTFQHNNFIDAVSGRAEFYQYLSQLS